MVVEEEEVMEMEVDVVEDEEMEVDVVVEEEMEVDVEEEEAMEVDPPAAPQAHAPHPLPAGRVGRLPPGWGRGWGGWSPLQGHCARSPRPGSTTATTALP